MVLCFLHSSQATSIEVILKAGSSISILVFPPSFAWEWNSQIRSVFLISKVSAPPFVLYWPIVFFKLLKKAAFSGNLKNPMTLCLFLLWSTTTLRYVAIYPRATTINSWRSFLKRIQVGFSVFCKINLLIKLLIPGY